jgi:hypothetical protein
MSEGPAKPRRRWLRFSLRTLFIVMTLCAITVGWWVSYARALKQRQLMLAEINNDGLMLTGLHATTGSHRPIWGLPIPADIERIKWLLFGEETYVQFQLVDGNFTADDVRRLQTAFPQAEIRRMSRHPDANGYSECLEIIEAPSRTSKNP